MKQETYWCGVDWATRSHAVCVVDDAGGVRARFEVPNTGNSFAGLLRRLVKLEVVGVGIERPDGAGELVVEPAVRAKLLRVSAATIDRLLAPDCKRLQVRGRSGTKPGSILKRQIPIRTFAEWDEARPGFCEVDLVAHDGGNPLGEFCQTLDLTCVNTGWTEMRGLPNKAQRWCFEALQDVEASLPFPLLGLDSEGGAEFINHQLFRYCADRSITFTRSRPYRGNDNCFVEQKNWPVVRQQVGYGRYDTPGELEILRELYRSLRLYVNYFQPQMRLVEKTRRGARVTRRHDRAQSPYQRLIASPHVAQDAKEALTRLYLTLNPAQLKREITRCQDRLLEVGRTKPRDRRKEVSNPPRGHLDVRQLVRLTRALVRRRDFRVSFPPFSETAPWRFPRNRHLSQFSGAAIRRIAESGCGARSYLRLAKAIRASKREATTKTTARTPISRGAVTRREVLPNKSPAIAPSTAMRIPPLCPGPRCGGAAHREPRWRPRRRTTLPRERGDSEPSSQTLGAGSDIQGCSAVVLAYR